MKVAPISLCGGFTEIFGRRKFWQEEVPRTPLGAVGLLIAVLLFTYAPVSGRAACEPCNSYAAGTSWGTVNFASLSEASGVAASRRNPGVLWTHNDGTRSRIYAVSTNGLLLATIEFGDLTEDLEDVAVGPGPEAGMWYLHLGDIGASRMAGEVRRQARVLRFAEPEVRLEWAAAPRSVAAGNVDTFTVEYPDGSFEAECLMVDPLSGDLLLGTKQNIGCRIYGAKLPNIPPGGPLSLSFLRVVPFTDVSGGSISPDGARIVVRREDTAMIWARCQGEPIQTALGRTGKIVPVVGPPSEPNGEAIGFLSDNSGYITLSEGPGPAVYFFASSCPMAPLFTVGLKNVSTYAGATVELSGMAAGYPAPTYEWRRNGETLGVTGSTLRLNNVSVSQAGTYELLAKNASGTATSSGTLQVQLKPDLRISEVQSSTAPSPGVAQGDWWELTSFESAPVNLTGWRFNDNQGGLVDPYVITTSVVIAPGESIVFAEDVTPVEFRNWWGSNALPGNLQVVTYGGTGLSLSANGDGLRLWSGVATIETEVVARVDFGVAFNGVTFNYDPVTSAFGQPSVLGLNGVLKAALSADIGSPGRIRAVPVSPRLRASAPNSMVSMQVEAQAGYVYQLESRTGLLGTAWGADGQPVRASASGPLFFERAVDVSARFYRLRVE